MQILIIVSSFFILIFLENERSLLGETINLAGKNRYFSAIIMHELMEYHITNNPSEIISNLNEYEENLNKLETILQKESSSSFSIPDEITIKFFHILDDYVILRTQVLSEIEKGGISNSKEKVFDFMLTNLISDTDALTVDISSHVDALSFQIILLELFLGIINIGTHIILVLIIIRIQKNDYKKQKQLEIKLQSKEKLSIIGQLTSRLTHDLRNPLSIIQVSMDIVKSKSNENKTSQKQFEQIDRSIERMTHQINDVLDFIREKPKTLEKTKFSKILSESLDSIKIPDTVKLILPKNDADILCDLRQLSIVLNNLILNAIQAIDNKGLVAIHLEEKNNEIIFQVEDSGKGISEEDLLHVFEPMFTTKKTGTGLGLVSVKTIVTSHGGTISVTSPPTIFTITLPKVRIK